MNSPDTAWVTLPELPAEDDRTCALCVFDGATGRLIREVAPASGGAVSVDELIGRTPLGALTDGTADGAGGGTGGGAESLSKTHPRLWRWVEERVATGVDPGVFAAELLTLMPDLPVALGDPPVPGAHVVIAPRTEGATPSLEDVSLGHELWIPAPAWGLPVDLSRGLRPYAGARRPEARYRPGPLPRLETPRSRQAAEGKSASLADPGISGTWDWRFKTYFLGQGGYGNDDGAVLAECTRRYLGPELTPGGIYSLVFRRDDPSGSLDELRRRPFRKNGAMLAPARVERDDWLVDRMLNGFHPILFRRTDEAGRQLFVDFVWDDYDFAGVDRDKVWGLAPHEGSKQQYELPNLRAELRRDDDTLSLSRILVTYRRGPRLRRATPERPMEHEPTALYTPDSPLWSYAKRLLRCQLALTGEMDAHLARGHLLVEQYLAALETTFGDRDRQHPVYRLLEPYLREVERINAFGDLLVVGSTGALRSGSALSARSIERRFIEELGALDWRGFRPRAPVVRGHRYAHAAAILWSTIRGFVEEVVRADMKEDSWSGVAELSRALTDHSPPYRPHLGLGHGHVEWLDDGELASHGRDEGAPSMSRLRSDPEGRVEDLVQLATHAIYHATFVHTWSNDRQFEDLGDPRHASFGLMSRRVPPVLDGLVAMEAWHREADPLVRDAGFQMTVARILTHMDHGHLMSLPRPRGPSDPPCIRARSEGDTVVHARLRELLCARRAELERLNEQDPFAGQRHERDRVDVTNVRSRINT